MKALPNVWAYPPKDTIMQSIGLQAKKQFALHSLLPSDPHLWAKQKEEHNNESETKANIFLLIYITSCS